MKLDDSSRLDVVEIARPWHASGLVSFLIALTTYQHPSNIVRTFKKALKFAKDRNWGLAVTNLTLLLPEPMKMNGTSTCVGLQTRTMAEAARIVSPAQSTIVCTDDMQFWYLMRGGPPASILRLQLDCVSRSAKFSSICLRRYGYIQCRVFLWTALAVGRVAQLV